MSPTSIGITSCFDKEETPEHKVTVVEHRDQL